MLACLESGNEMWMYMPLETGLVCRLHMSEKVVSGE